MLTINDISLTIADKQILKNITYNLTSGVVGLVGANGAGKTTLFKIIMKQLKPDSGTISAPHELIGYLPQELRADKLSGGERTKNHILQLIRSVPKPTILLLDEPTNNLDLNAVRWLEGLIRTFPGPVLLSSHDRQFLDDTVDSIIELDNGELKQYGGNYSFYKEQKGVEKEAYERKYLAQQKTIHDVEDNITAIKGKAYKGEETFSSRNPYQRRKIKKSAHQGVVRQRKLEKFLASEERLDKPVHRKDYPFRFEGDTHSRKFILSFNSVSKSYDRPVLTNVSGIISGKEHIWLSGPNGSGKTTLLKIAAGLMLPDRGTIEKGTGVRIGYFSQEMELPQPGQTAIDILQKLGATSTEVFRYGAFMALTKEDLTQPVSALSRGQHTKLAFIRLLMGNNQLLILDEPTNHLEMETREKIEEALQGFQGAILVASHDRYFLEKIGVSKEFKMPE
ncbi:MAG: hypothetical protein RI947_1344 [Candidatus Parcubacteria bacterium]|jgi:ATPase subunit of ABC transporter with duplicated ATPase domains